MAWETLFEKVLKRLPPECAPAREILSALRLHKVYYLDLEEIGPSDVRVVREAVGAAREYFEREQLAGPYRVEPFLAKVDELIELLPAD